MDCKTDTDFKLRNWLKNKGVYLTFFATKAAPDLIFMWFSQLATRKSCSNHVTKILLSIILGEGAKSTGSQKGFQKFKYKAC